MKTHEEFLDWLGRKDACAAAIKWVFYNNLTPQKAWDQCNRGDWLLWWCFKEKVENRLLTLAAGKCAETVIDLMTDQRSKDAVKASIDYGNGLIKLDELKVHARAAAAAYTTADADAAAAYTTADADAAYTTAAAATAAAAAADAAAYTAATAAAAAYTAEAYYYSGGQKACEENQKLTADIVRSIIKPNFL